MPVFRIYSMEMWSCTLLDLARLAFFSHDTLYKADSSAPEHTLACAFKRHLSILAPKLRGDTTDLEMKHPFLDL